MPAMIWDETTQAFKEAETPKIWNESAQAFADAEGKVYKDGAWEDCFKKLKSFTLTIKFTPKFTSSYGNLTLNQVTAVFKYNNNTNQIVRTSISGNQNTKSASTGDSTAIWHGVYSYESPSVTINYDNDGNTDTEFVLQTSQAFGGSAYYMESPQWRIFAHPGNIHVTVQNGTQDFRGGGVGNYNQYVKVQQKGTITFSTGHCDVQSFTVTN